MEKLHAAITGVHGWVPDDILTNADLEKMVDTTDEWIMTRIGIKERHILKGENQGTSVLGANAVAGLLKKTNTKPEEIDVVICATISPDSAVPSVSTIICDKVGIKNAFAFDVNAACSGFLYAMEVASNFIAGGKYKKIIVVGCDKMSSITDYTDRTTCPLFGDAGAAVLVEPTMEDVGVMDSILRADGYGGVHLHVKSGGSARPASYQTIDNKEHFIYQEGQAVFKAAVSNMADVSVAIMERNHIASEDLAWLVPHQANLRIISATGKRMGLNDDQVMINIEKYGNTTAATVPLCLWDYEKKLKKGDKIILATFGAGYTWGAMYIKWAYDGQ